MTQAPLDSSTTTTTTTSSCIAFQEPDFTRQRNIMTTVLYPGAVRMCGSNPVTTDEEEQFSTTIHMDDEDRSMMHTSFDDISPPILVNAELVVVPSNVQDGNDDNDDDDNDMEEGGVVRNADRTVDAEITSAAIFEDKQIIQHLLRQRRVQVVLVLLILVFVALVVGMIMGLSSSTEPKNTVVVSNGTVSSSSEDYNSTPSTSKEHDRS